MTDGKNGVGAEAEKLAEKLTRYPDSNIFKHDNKKYYEKGEGFPHLDGIRDGKLKDALLATKGKETPTKEGQKALEEAAKIIVSAEKSLAAKEPKEAKIPLARLVETANQYYAVGDNTTGDKLLEYAIQQAELIEKPKLKSQGEEGPITGELKEYKAAIDEHYNKQSKSSYKGSAIDRKFDTLIAASETVTLDKKTTPIPSLVANTRSLS